MNTHNNTIQALPQRDIFERALSPVGQLSVTDYSGIIIGVNDRFCEATGYARDELIGKDHAILNSGHHSKEFMASLRATIARGQIWHGHICNRTKDGTRYWVEMTIIPFLDELRKPYRYYALGRDSTKEIQSAGNLEFSNLALVQAQELAKLGSWEWRFAREQATWSEEMYRIYGVSPASGPLKFGEIPQFYTPQSWAALQAEVAKTVEFGTPFHIECEIIRANQERGYVINKGAALRDAHNTIIGICGTMMDITERKRIEERNRLIVNALPDPLFVLNNENVFVDYHASDLKRLALPPEEFLGKPVGQVLPADIVEKIESAIAEVRKSNTPALTAYRMEEQGTSRAFEAILSALDSDRILVIVRDVTDRENADALLREQATLLDKATDAIIVQSLDWQILSWNKAAERIYGWKSEEVLGCSMRGLLHENTDEFDLVLQVLMEKGEFNHEINQQTKDGRRITVEARWTRLQDETGNAKSVLCIASDITERKRLEQQFLRAQRLESIGTLAGGIAHDLNNVLTPILLATEILKTRELKPDDMDLLAIIEASVRHGTGMVRQILSFASGGEGNPRPMDLRTLCSDLKPIIKDTFPKNILFEMLVADDLWLVNGDNTELHQVLMNFAVNARDAMPTGGRMGLSLRNCRLDALHAGMQIDAKPGNYVVIEMEDSGVGIAPDAVERIFEPFFTTKLHGKGTGLGLSTAFTIVKSHGGFIHVQSELNRGTKFQVYLPAISSEFMLEEPKGDTNMPRGNGECILIVDDESAVLEATQRTLEAFGYRTITAEEGAEAIAVFSQNKDDIALVLTDMMMPVLDGAATIRVLLKMEPTLPIIAVSGLDMRPKVATFASHQNVRSLQKPYQASVLLRTIEESLHQSQKQDFVRR